MTKFLALFCKILITLPVIIFLLFLTLSNREQVMSLTWSPLHEAVLLSLPLIIFGALVLGFIWGSLILWSNTLELRAERRALKKDIVTLENRINIQKAEIDRLSAHKITAAPIVAQPTPRIATPEVL